MTNKERHTIKILEYLGNPDNDFCNRTQLGMEVLGYKTQDGIYKCFTVAELNSLEAQALEIRRQKFAKASAKIDRALYDAAVKGDTAAIKLWYQKMENWLEKSGMSVDLGGNLMALVADMFNKGKNGKDSKD